MLYDLHGNLGHFCAIGKGRNKLILLFAFAWRVVWMMPPNICTDVAFEHLIVGQKCVTRYFKIDHRAQRHRIDDERPDIKARRGRPGRQSFALDLRPYGRVITRRL